MRTFVSALLSCVVLLVLAGGKAHCQQLVWELVSPNPDSMGCFGGAVAMAGDVNGDGHDDVIVGASRVALEVPAGEGRAYVFSGATGETLYTLLSPQGTQGYFGNAVSGIGDVDGDGYDDVVVGAWYEDAGAVEAGAAYVFSGQMGALLYTLASPNPTVHGLFGSRVSGAGDVDDDGYPDLAVGAPLEDYQKDQDGRAYVFSGATGVLLHTLVSPNPNPQYQDWFGASVSGIGDVNDDGYADVAVASDEEIPPFTGVGKVYVFSGATGDTLYATVSPNQEYHAHFGWSTSQTGDMDGDGYGDLVVGAWGESPLTLSQAGRAYVLSGATGDLLHELVSPIPWEGSRFGYSVSGAGNVDNDACADVIVGVPFEDPGAAPDDAGRAYVFCGVTGPSLVSPNEEAGGNFGWSVSGGGDVDGGGDDVVVGAPHEDAGAPDAGRAYVFRFPPTSAPDGATVGAYGLTLDGPFPNPSDGTVCLSIRVPAGARGADLSLYSLNGRCIAALPVERLREGGVLSLGWTAPAGLAPGVYRWHLDVGGQQLQRSWVLTK
jgi:hypothetical protein